MGYTFDNIDEYNVDKEVERVKIDEESVIAVVEASGYIVLKVRPSKEKQKGPIKLRELFEVNYTCWAISWHRLNIAQGISSKLW